MAIAQAPAESVVERAGPIIDLFEDVLHLDTPLRPSVRRRVRAANDEAIRTLRHLAAEDDTLLRPENVRTICNAVAHRHGVKPRFMLTMREIGEQLTLEFAAALLPSNVRTRLIASAVHLERRRVVTDPTRRRAGDQRPDPRVEQLALAQVVLAVLAIIGGAVMLAGGRTTWGLGFAIAATSLVVIARAVLAISTDRRARALPGTPGAARLAPDIDLRSPDA